MTHYIYTLSHPTTNEVRYVGKTINIKRRYKQHLYDKLHSYKASWVKSLRNENLKPILTIIEECCDENWEDRERYWITQFDNLTNTKQGGNGGDDYKRVTTEETRDKLRQANIGKVLSEEHKEKIRINNGMIRKINIDNIEYISISDASRRLNIPITTIIQRLNNINKDNYFYIKHSK